MMRKSLRDRFEEKFIRGNPDECWEWTAYKSRKGYGQLQRGRRGEGLVLAHRYALEIKLGRPLREGMQATHDCDNPGCVNPHHLQEGTDASNKGEAAERGLMKRGEDHHNSILCKEDVYGIRLLHEEGLRAPEIAEEFLVSPSTVYDVLNGRTWSWV